MWLCTKHGFFSVVQNNQTPGEVLVRARDVEHLRALNLGAPIRVTPNNDYPFRVHLCRARFAELLATLADGITYGNFKGEVDRRHGLTNWYARALHEVWRVFWDRGAFARPTGKEEWDDDQSLLWD